MFRSVEEAIKAGKYKRKVPTPKIKDRWAAGIDHEPESEKLVHLISRMDFENFNDSLCLKVGGDGDNGESLAYVLDALIETGMVEIRFPAAPEREE